MQPKKIDNGPLGFKIVGGLVIAQFVVIMILNMVFSSEDRVTMPIGGLFALLAFQVFYLIPGLIAGARRHKNEAAVWLVNVFLGWTFIGWIGALIWALSNQNPQQVEVTNTAPVAASTSPSDIGKYIEGLISLREKGLITEDEFEKKRADALERMA